VPAGAVRAWQVVRHGRPSEALSLEAIEVDPPGPGQLLVEVEASPLNYNEVDGCHGRYRTIDPPLPYTLGMEVVGTVAEAGLGAEDWTGRRVMATTVGAIGGHAERAVASADAAFDVPPSLAGPEAAALYFPFHLAHLGLHERARLRAGETVLVHAAAGGVGSAALQLAVAAGARVIATAGSVAKRELARSLGADVVIDYRDVDFVDAVADATDGRGVDVCFDGVGGDVTLQSLRCLARNGRHLVVGFASGIEAEDVPTITGRALCFGQVSVLGVLLAYSRTPLPVGSGVHLVPREVGEAVHASLLELLDAGRIRPIVGQVVAFEDLPAALDAMEDRATTGRVVLVR
jgi:NADPH2:quinone reductase